MIKINNIYHILPVSKVYKGGFNKKQESSNGYFQKKEDKKIFNKRSDESADLEKKGKHIDIKI